MDEIVSYTTWTGAPVVHRHLPSGATAAPMLTMRDEMWCVRDFEQKDLSGILFRREADAIKYMVEQCKPTGGVTPDTVLSRIAYWANGYMEASHDRLC